MRVLVTGRAIPHAADRSTGQQLAIGFQEAGHDAVFYGNFYGEPYRWLGAQEATTEEFDLIVITEMNDGIPGYELNTLNLKGTPRLYWDFDVSYHPERSFRRAMLYRADGYLVGNKNWINQFATRMMKPSLHLPYACSPSIHKRKDDISRNYLLGFVGSLTPEREKTLQVVRGAMYNSAWLDHTTGVFADDLVDRTNTYCAMLHHNQNACHGLVPGRPWETTACGTTLLMDRNSYNDFIEFLPEHLHDDVFVYDNDNDVIRWVKLWGDKWASLQLCGDSLMAYVHKNHAYKNRAETIIEWGRNEGILHN